MARAYVKVFFDWKNQMAALSDAEKGRLYDAILDYGMTGTAPDLGGREGILFPVFQSQIDRDIKSYQSKVDAGRKGGLAKASRVLAKSSTTLAKASKSYQEKEEEKEEEKEKDISPPPSSSENKGLQKVVREWDKARGGITSCAEGERITDLFDTYGEQAMLYAIRQAVDHDAVRIAYVEAVLKRAPYTRDLTEEEKRRNREAILADE